MSATLFKYKNSKKWYIRLHRPGSGAGKKEVIPTRTADRREAETILDKMKGDLASGNPLPKAGAHSVRFAELCTELQARYERRNKGSAKQTDSRFKCHIVKFLGADLAINIDEQRIEQYKRHRELEHAALKSIDNELQQIVAAFQVGQELFRIPGPKIKRYSKKEKNNPRQGFFELDEFVGVLDKMPDDDRRDYFWTLAITGWRYGEVQNIRRRHVSLKRGELRLDPGSANSKTGEARTFPLTDILMDIFKRRMAVAGHADDHVFTYQSTYKDGRPRGKRRPIGDMRACWMTACYQAGIPCKTEPWSYVEPKSGKRFSGVRVLKASKTPHDLRRSVAKLLSDEHVPDRVGMALLGHQTMDMYIRYGIVAAGNLRDAKDALNAACNAVVESATSGREVVENDRNRQTAD